MQAGRGAVRAVRVRVGHPGAITYLRLEAKALKSSSRVLVDARAPAISP